ncbi:MAG: hypothetical protein JXB07_12250 [Anaerolineae bacterium]|nr:hypothetical protein [Anaerolineae bacterium]
MEYNSAEQDRPAGKEDRHTIWIVVGIAALVVLCLCTIVGAIMLGGYFFLGVSTVGMSPPVVAVATVQLVSPTTPTPVAMVTLPSTQSNMSVPAGEGLPNRIDSGQITLDAITVALPEQTIGPVLRVEITNTSDEEIVVTIPCGLIFEPEDSGEQPMMVIQETSVTVPASGSASVEAMVACIDASRSAPSGEASYTVGRNAEGELMTLATCLCHRDMDIEDDIFSSMGTQFAVWSISDGIDLHAMFDIAGQDEGAIGDLFGGELSELLALSQELFIDEAEAILEECEVSSP